MIVVFGFLIIYKWFQSEATFLLPRRTPLGLSYLWHLIWNWLYKIQSLYKIIMMSHLTWGKCKVPKLTRSSTVTIIFSEHWSLLFLKVQVNAFKTIYNLKSYLFLFSPYKALKFKQNSKLKIAKNRQKRPKSTFSFLPF